ncbi:hypothetical protein JWJ90_00215 [Desulfobulbus rhabdoformis]|uniref:hypothetical protein n=1 Tax=Desulfobulbus rhabdoformis TaxID=34032 RepID=UPI0019632C5F|nr:hypothetical protein [Desulfobulbus rhabdoformis]MBM9612703.1 hypothetical protein [Desulfobulbus rhabdoformis]
MAKENDAVGVRSSPQPTCSPTQGLQEKAVVATAFLNRKLAEYETLRQEIEQLRREVEGNER